MAAAGRRQRRLLALNLSSGMTIADAARAAGTSERTAHRLLKNPRFSDAVRRIQGQMRRRVVGRLTDACTAAVDTLLALLRDDVPATARLGAARAVLEHSGRMAEVVELEHRIAALERAAQEGPDATEFAATR